MSSILNADLHCHSVVSDGTLTPEELAVRAAANGVELWALTDHDEVGGQHRAAAAARANGMSNRDIATDLEISEHTVKVHLWRLFRRLGVKSRTQALHYARTNGLLSG